MTVIQGALPPPDRTGGGSYQLRLAASRAEKMAAAQLRDRVFAAECTVATRGTDPVDFDADDGSVQLLVWHTSSPGGPEAVVAADRLLPPHANRCTPRSLGLSAHTAFDLTPLEPILDTAIDTGRAYVDPEHRGSAAVALLWTGIARYMLKTGSRYLLGYASLPVFPGGGQAALFYDVARARFWASPRFQCRPRNPLPVGRVPRSDLLHLPPLLHEYLQLGATICGPPAFDDHFGVADFLILLDIQHTDPLYLRQFLHRRSA